MSKNDHPWDRRDEESEEAFEAFVLYRDMGVKRSIRAVAQALGKSHQLMAVWSSPNDWPNRARAYDKWLDQQATQAWADERRAQVAKTNALSDLLIERAAQRVSGSAGAIPHDAIRAAEVAAKIQSQAMGDVRPETQGEKESGLMIDAAELVKEMYRRAAEEGQDLG